MTLNFSKKYFLIFTGILLTEIYIAVYVHDQFVRPLVGDLLVVLLIYSFVRAFIEAKNNNIIAIFVLLFAYLVELGQYFQLVSRLGLANSKLASTIMGTSFDWNDMLAYTIGFILILLEIRIRKRKSH